MNDAQRDIEPKREQAVSSERTLWRTPEISRFSLERTLSGSSSVSDGQDTEFARSS